MFPRRSSLTGPEGEPSRMKSLKGLERRIQECTKKYRSSMQFLKDQIQEAFRHKERAKKRLEEVEHEMKSLDAEKPLSEEDVKKKASNRSEGLMSQMAQRGKILEEQRVSCLFPATPARVPNTHPLSLWLVSIPS